MPKILSKDALLFLTILIEGYVVLAVELLAIRTLIPFVGSGTEVIAIVISAVLLPLAVGYHRGGVRYQREAARRGAAVSVRKILLKNLLNSLILLTIGLSYAVQEVFFSVLSQVGVKHHILQTAVFCLCFLVYPVYLLAQTIPLLSNFFSSRHLSAITGKMLFFSTIGSFGGSVFSTIVLMTTIGVHYTLVVTMGLLAFVVMLLARNWWRYDNVLALAMLGLCYLLNNGAWMRDLSIVENNPYSMVKVYDDPQMSGKRTILDINRSPSSAYAKNPEDRFDYIRYMERNFLKPLLKKDSSYPPKKILVLGAGGFVFGLDDDKNDYTFVDIDGRLKEVAEEHFLPEKLGPNKHFVPMSARAFLQQHHEQPYDLVLVDTYSNMYSISPEVVTAEFLLDIKKILAKDGILIANVISSPDFTDRFTIRYDNTFRSVFGHFVRQAVMDFDPWDESHRHYNNMLYIYFNRPAPYDKAVYTDDLNTYSLDR